MKNKEQTNACYGCFGAAKMIITVIITGKQSIRENICTWNFGCKSWRQLKIMNREIDNPELLEEENVHGTD